MAFLGMRGTGDWATDERPKNWRQGILYQYPNGDVPLTALLSKLKERRVDDPEFNWWTKGLPAQAATVTNVYTDAALTTAYTTGGAAGDTLYINTSAAATTQEFRVGHQVLLRNTANYLDDCNAKVTSVTVNGASSVVAAKLLEADPTTTGIADCNRLLVIGNINAEGAVMPDNVAYDPTKYTNYTQIFRTPLSITRTAQRTRLRTSDAYKEAKREALELHGVEIEKAFLWGIGTEGVGSNGKPERTTEGLIPFVRTYGVSDDFSLNTDYSGEAWLDAGETWLDEQLEEMFRYGSDERMAYCGSGVILAINKLVKEYGNFDFTPKTVSYGINVMQWTTPFGVIMLKRHPLFSFEATNRNSLIAFEPKNLIYAYIDDTTFYADDEKQNTGRNHIDGREEEFLTECGLEFHHPNTCAFLNGFGTDNTV